MADLGDRLLLQDLLDVEWPRAEPTPAGAERSLEGLVGPDQFVAHGHDELPLETREQVGLVPRIGGALAIVSPERTQPFGRWGRIRRVPHRAPLLGQAGSERGIQVGVFGRL